MTYTSTLLAIARRFAAFATAALVAGCAAVDPAVYADRAPKLDLAAYLNGSLEGHGMFVDRGGVVQRTFVVSIDARWVDGVGTLDERFVWSDGEKERRVWTLRSDGSGRWTGTADGVLGAASGVVSGNALRWTYRYRLATKERKTYDVDFDDWMFQIDQNVMLNRARISWYGFEVGEVLISFRRL